jgi:phage terminase large subunit GpA-like protein
MMKKASESWMPPLKRSTLQWLEEEYRLPEEGADLPGPYNPEYVPYLWGIFAALDDSKAKIVVMMKAAQIGWTYGLIGWLLKRIETKPTPMIVLFPKDGAAREFSDEKFVPAAKATPIMEGKVNVSISRSGGNRALFKKFMGGFLKLLGSNSISNVKSTPAPLAVVEEPDDTSDNVKDQGDAIKLIRERLKRFREGKLVLGGTPSTAGISKVEEYTKLSDQRVLPITCHECEEQHVLDWENVSWITSEEGEPHAVFGMAQPDTAVYCCPHCGCVWDDWRRQRNIIETVLAARDAGDPYYGWTPTKETSGGIVGFKELNELYVCLPGTSLADVVRDYLEAEHEAGNGDESGRIVFQNAKLARTYEYKDDAPDAEVLKEKAQEYSEKTVPHGGLVLSFGADVQDDRIAIVIRAWGREEESWLVWWGEIYGNTVDKKDPVWGELADIVFADYRHECGALLNCDAGTIDSSDGGTNDAVYSFVKKYQKKGVMAGKGSSNDYGTKEIFSRPKRLETKGKYHTKADKYGLRVFIVGTHNAKDLISARIKLKGIGAGRMHVYKDVRADYYDQLLGEVKAPHRSIRSKRVWQKKSGARVEALDCEVYCLHAARSIRVNSWSEAKWAAVETKVMQSDLFKAEQPETHDQPESPNADQRQTDDDDWHGDY